MAVTPTPDRDAALDRILRRFAIPAEPTLEDTPVSEDCLDAETIAAMADGGLSPQEQAAVAEHALSCARCREVIAAVIRTTPEPPPRRAWWQLPSLRWLAPAVATGLAVVIWVAVANRYPDVTTVSVPVPERKERVAASAPEAREAKPDASATPAERDVPVPPPPASAAKDAVAIGGRAFRSDAVDERQGALEKRKKAAEPLGQDAAAKPQKEESIDKYAAVAPVGQLPATPAPAPPPAPASPPPSAAASSVAGAAGRAGAPRAAQESTRKTEGFADRAAANLTMDAVFVVIPDVTSPDPRSRWRISGTTVQRSTDNGETWTPQDTGTAVRLTAGSSPNPDICWVVGDQGTVLVSVDGRSWQRLKPPDPATLVAVRATSADAATVTTRDGRTFVTRDRGQNWGPQ
jgi:Putative zinc-finger